MILFNAILGGTPNSKLFQNVREKASLAYTVRSIYIKQKGSFYFIAEFIPRSGKAPISSKN